MTTATDRIRVDDGVCVHDHLVYQDTRGGWWASRNRSVLFGSDRDELLQQVGEAAGSDDDVETLRGRLARSVERAARLRAQEDLLRIRMGNRPPGSHRCSRCGGLGTVSKGAGRVTCPVCGGAGIVPNK